MIVVFLFHIQVYLAFISFWLPVVLLEFDFVVCGLSTYNCVYCIQDMRYVLRHMIRKRIEAAMSSIRKKPHANA